MGERERELNEATYEWPRRARPGVSDLVRLGPPAVALAIASLPKARRALARRPSATGTRGARSLEAHVGRARLSFQRAGHDLCREVQLSAQELDALVGEPPVVMVPSKLLLDEAARLEGLRSFQSDCNS